MTFVFPHNKIISLAQVVAGPVQPYWAESWSKTTFYFLHCPHASKINILSFFPLLLEASVVQWKQVGLLANRSCDRSSARGMVHVKIHLIHPGCLWPSLAWQCRILAKNTNHSFRLPFLFSVFGKLYYIFVFQRRSIWVNCTNSEAVRDEDNKDNKEDQLNWNVEWLSMAYSACLAVCKLLVNLKGTYVPIKQS